MPLLYNIFPPISMPNTDGITPIFDMSKFTKFRSGLTTCVNFPFEGDSILFNKLDSYILDASSSDILSNVFMQIYPNCLNMNDIIT